MIAYNSSGKEVVSVLENDLKQLTAQQGDKIMREIAQALTSAIVIRVHQDGKAADGSKIGTYSPNYMKIRTGKWKYKGDKLNRTASTQVILSLKKQMEMDLTTCEQNPAKIPNGYAIGYTNDLNYEKAIGNEQRYGKKILTQLSKEEEALALLILQNRIDDIFTR